MASKKKNNLNSIFAQIKAFFKKIDKKRDSEYSKRLLTKIVNHSLLMMWGTYVLAWFGRTEIAEALSKTIPTSIIAVVVGYLAKSVIENISKHTDTFGKNINLPDINQAQGQTDDYINMNRDC